MTDDVATRLLDAQVEWVLAQLSGDRLAELIERDVDDLLALADELRVDAVADPDQVKASLRRLVELAGSGPLVDDLVAAFADALYDLGAAEEHRLGDVVARDRVEALIEKLLSMKQLHDRAMEQLAQSPLVATVSARFVASIVNDFVAQNRQLAEKLPGAKSLFSLGASAASRARSIGIVGEAAERGTQLAIRRTNNAMREVIKDAPVKEAALEVWDLHADEPISELRGYLSRADLRELALLVSGIVSAARTTEYVGTALDECVDVFFAHYGDWSVAALLPELGIDRDDLVGELRALIPPAVAAAREEGRLAALVRERLAPFFASPEVAAILGR
ncbi:MAG TPA: hypothetical protein VHC23_09155 [Jatrophihabitans sp.]|nr:hypothetical protein [Jatrophihabitans sp.]